MAGDASPPPQIVGRDEFSPEGIVSTAEQVIVAAMLALAVLLRFLYLFRYRFDSDESQHLHVAWEWTQGLLQYRDFFDNHAPLFHMISAPLAAFVGESSDILYVMRGAMTPLYLVALVSAFLLGRSACGPRVGMWSAALLALTPDFFFKSLEYRTDVLWMALWAVTLVVLIGWPLKWQRAFVGGLLMGAAAATSLKTILLLASLAGAIGMTVLRRHTSVKDLVHRLWGRCAAFSAGFILVPTAIVLYFAAHGALGPLYYGTIQHNLIAAAAGKGATARACLLIPALVVLFFLVPRVAALAHSPRVRKNLILLMDIAGLYFVTAGTLWTIVTLQDLLPFWPVAIVVVAWLLIEAAGRIPLGSRHALRTSVGACLLGAIAMTEIALIQIAVPLRTNRTVQETQVLDDVIHLTGPSDYILDLKGETVFRRRPYYYVMELLTRRGLERHLIPNTVIDDLIATRTYVAIENVGHFPRKARSFLQSNYLVVGRLRVAGRLLSPQAALPTGAIPFEIAIPGRYAVVSEAGFPAGRLDGTEYSAPTFLSAGQHQFLPEMRSGRLAVIWAQAAERGFLPFASARARGAGEGDQGFAVFTLPAAAHRRISRLITMASNKACS